MTILSRVYSGHTVDDPLHRTALGDTPEAIDDLFVPKYV